ncbi:flavin-containing monooxygenase [Arthrobacter sp. B6]|uniref:flavin-containing monooxygenase n=1 Tax=Arthrobacter sp. B6 TaxID=1570137 RepID=UPI00082F0EA9|nr:NAD(P)/FAD-dependent oxidoreductase [Arthrobacter sp. B6]
MSKRSIAQDSPAALDAVVVGAGITGIYQLHRLKEMGLSVALYEDGAGVGGTWFWNRYPGARFDSESYSYGYFFDEQLLQEWDWKELFASQPEIEQYLNYVVDRQSLRPLIHSNTRVVGAFFDEDTALWTVTLGTGESVLTKYLVSAVGILSAPFTPDIPNHELFRGEMHHTGRWPQTPVSFKGKKVAVIGTGASGVQIVPVIAGEVETLTVFQRTPNWATPLNNRPISAEEMAEIKATYPAIYEKVSQNKSGLPHDADPRSAFDVTEEERLEKYEALWNSPGLRKITENFRDTELDSKANTMFTEFLEKKIRSLVNDPSVAERLIPKDHGFGGKRPPFEAGYFEAFNRENVSLVDMRADPIVTFTEQGLNTVKGHHEFDIIVLATGFDAGTGALLRMNIHGREGLSLADAWKDGPRTLLGVMVPGFPNLLIAGGPHGTRGNVPRSSEMHVDWISDLINFTEQKGSKWIEPTPEAADAYTAHVYETAGGGKHGSTQASAWYNGGNIPGKANHFLLSPDPHPEYRRRAREVADDGYRGVTFA